jgi:DNA-binding NtrC family response regulator
MISVLFVDDEPNLLAGLKRSFQSRRGEWSMRFAGSGAEALKLLEATPADVVVSDMVMPGMSGAELLATVRKTYPKTILIILSGQCDRGTALRTVDPSHLHLAKPCNTIELATAIDRTYRLRSLIGLVARRNSDNGGPLASSPVYAELARVLRDPNVEIETVADLIARDPTLTARLLKLINTAFSGASWSARSPLQIINLLGIDLVRAMVFDIARATPG